MIDTVIFDIGNVLVKFDYMPFIHRLLGDEETVTHVNDAIWYSGYWDDLDRDTKKHIGAHYQKIIYDMLVKNQPLTVKEKKTAA